MARSQSILPHLAKQWGGIVNAKRLHTRTVMGFGVHPPRRLRPTTMRVYCAIAPGGWNPLMMANVPEAMPNCATRIDTLMRLSRPGWLPPPPPATTTRSVHQLGAYPPPTRPPLREAYGTALGAGCGARGNARANPPPGGVGCHTRCQRTSAVGPTPSSAIADYGLEGQRWHAIPSVRPSQWATRLYCGLTSEGAATP